MVVTVGLSTTACSVSSCPSTNVSSGTLRIQDSRQQPSLASEPQWVYFAPSARSATILPATALWPPCSSSSIQCCLLLPISLQGAWRRSRISVLHGIRELASGHPARIITFVQHASVRTGPKTVQICQQTLSINQLSPGAHMVSLLTFLLTDNDD